MNKLSAALSLVPVLASAGHAGATDAATPAGPSWTGLHAGIGGALQ